MLTVLGYDAEGSTQPAEALALVRADPGRFAPVLTDQTMPGMTGLQLAAELRAIRPDLPVVLMNGQAQTMTSERLAAAGVAEFLSKPMTLQAIGSAMRDYLAQHIAP